MIIELRIKCDLVCTCSYAVKHRTKMFGDQSFVIKVSHDGPATFLNIRVAPADTLTHVLLWDTEVGAGVMTPYSKELAVLIRIFTLEASVCSFVTGY